MSMYVIFVFEEMSVSSKGVFLSCLKNQVRASEKVPSSTENKKLMDQSSQMTSASCLSFLVHDVLCLILYLHPLSLVLYSSSSAKLLIAISDHHQ